MNKIFAGIIFYLTVITGFIFICGGYSSIYVDTILIVCSIILFIMCKKCTIREWYKITGAYFIKKNIGINVFLE